jgi:hypothetical protein
MKNGNTPVYIIPKDAPEIDAYRETFKYLDDNKCQGLTLCVHQDMVKDGEVMMLQEMIPAMQHYPQIIEQMILGIELKFTEIEDSGIYFPDSYWKREVEYYRWFHKMFDMPLVLFFLHDEDARFYCLAGDMLADKAVTVTGEVDRGGRSTIEFTNEQVGLMASRLHHACWLMLVYCHASGFDPKSYIEAMIANFDFHKKLSYETVYKAYKKDIEGGLKLMIKPTGPKRF